MSPRWVKLLGVCVVLSASACIDRDERVLLGGGSTGGSGAQSSGGAGAAAGTSSASGGTEPMNDAGAGAEAPTAGTDSGGTAGAGGTAGSSSVEPIDDFARWHIPNQSGLNLPYVQAYQVGDEIATDTITGLVWLARPSQTSGDYEAAVKLCDELDHAGFDDWRLPTRMELVSIVDYGKSNPAIDSVVFPGSPSGPFWSMTKSATTVGAYLQVNFEKGTMVLADPVNHAGFVRCVRGYPDVPPPHYEEGAGYIYDTYTGLMWEYPKSMTPGSHAAASGRCLSIVIDGKDDWRLPSVAELQSLIDHSEKAPVIDHDWFKDLGTGAMRDWSLTPSGQEYHWLVHWEGGALAMDTDSTPNTSRCVRFEP